MLGINDITDHLQSVVIESLHVPSVKIDMMGINDFTDHLQSVTI